MRFYKSLIVFLLVSSSAGASVVNSSKSGHAVTSKPITVGESSSDSLMPFVSKPVIKIDDKASKLNKLLSWCELREGERSLVDNEYGVFGFVTEEGLLKDNIKELVNDFYPKNQRFIDKTQNHRVASRTCILERSKKAVIQKIIEPYRHKKVPIFFGNFKNDVAVLFYRNDVEMSKYLKVR